MDKKLIEKMLDPEVFKELEDVLVFEEIDSTNSECMRLLEAGLQGNQLILANTQSAGRGRRGRHWSSLPGAGIYFSLLKEFSLPPDALQSLSLVTALALQEALEQLGIVDIELKWPNDILYKKKKLAGILLELQKSASSLHLIFGVGINLNLPAKALAEIDQPATDLKSIMPNPIVPEALVATFCNELFKAIWQFEEGGFAPFQHRWNSLDRYVDSDIVIDNGNKRLIGKSLGVNEIGALVLQTVDGQIEINGGEIFPSLRESRSESDS